MGTSVPMIEDHFKKKPQAVDDSPDLNDREEVPQEVEFKEPEEEENDEEDNILRGKNSQVSIEIKNEDDED